jgi:hypothetical protein
LEEVFDVTERSVARLSVCTEQTDMLKRLVRERETGYTVKKNVRQQQRTVELGTNNGVRTRESNKRELNTAYVAG